MSAPGRLRIALLAAVLGCGTLGLALSTTEGMGYTRDESFYFDFAESYQDWFTRVSRAEDPAAVRTILGRGEVGRTWSGNSEHPPLMKTLFGWSWALLARKDRPVAGFAEGRGDATFQVNDLGASTGFEVGSEIVLLAPQAQEQPQADPSRELARGAVTRRDARSAVVSVAGAERATLEARCATGAKPADLPPLTAGCMAREARSFALLSEGDAMRLPGMASAALAVVLTFLLGLALFDARVGMAGALMFLFTPRHFWHAHLACFDMPIVAMTLLTLYAYWRSFEDRRWALLAGVGWGLALLTKHNAFFLPAALVIFWFWAGRDRFRIGRIGWRLAVELPPVPLALLVMPVVALPLLFHAWPRLWVDPFSSVAAWFEFHFNHVHYLQSHFGEPLQVPPFPVSVPTVLTAMTVPEVWLWLMPVGVLYAAPPTRLGSWLRAAWRRTEPTRRERALAFCLLNGLLPIALISLPSVPIFGGTKHWMTGMPFLMLLAGFGLVSALDALGRQFSGTRLRSALATGFTAFCLAAVFAYPVRTTLDAAPYGSAYYNALVAGGIQGAADLGMMRAYWGFVAGRALGWLNEHAPPHARVYWGDTTPSAVAMYHRDGQLRWDVGVASRWEHSYAALIETQQSFEEEDLLVRRGFGAVGPTYIVAYRGVPLLNLYTRTPIRPSVSPAGP